MPLPKPRPREREQDFISRCMGNDTALNDFPDNNQRAGVCYNLWRESKKTRSVREQGYVDYVTKDNE